MAEAEGTWLVLVRDVSGTVRVRGESRIVAAFVLDADTGLIRGVAAASDPSEALTTALSHGLREPAGSLPPGPPEAVWCAAGFADTVEAVLHTLGIDAPLAEVQPPAAAEDVFDSFVGHMAGRAQPDDLPEPADFALLYAHALDFLRAAPWERWHDGIVLALETRVGSVRSTHAAVVMGNAGEQYGLVLYPGDHLPAGLDEWEPGRPVPVSAGTLLFTLDPPGEVPDELRAKADRYGWPPDAEFDPAFLRLDSDRRGGDPGRLDVQRVTVALAAVTAYDAHRPVPVGAPTKGEVALADGRRGRFAIQQQPSRQPQRPRFQVHEVGHDMIPAGTPVVVGHVTAASLAELRRQARLHRPIPPGTPAPTRGQVPLIVAVPAGGQGDRLAAEIANLDPFGVGVIETDDGMAVLVLAGGNGAQALSEVDAGSPAVAALHRRLRTTGGVHAVMVADEETTRGKGTVYGLFECVQPPPPAPRTGRAQPPRRRRSKNSPKR